MTLHLRRTYEDSDRFCLVDCDGFNVGAIIHDTTRSEPVWDGRTRCKGPDIAKSGMTHSRADAMREFREGGAATVPGSATSVGKNG